MLAVGLLAACSPSQVVVRGAMPLMEGGRLAMNREGDLVLAETALPATIKLLEGMLLEDPGNARLRGYVSEAVYGYTFAFVEPRSPGRAQALYARCRDNASRGLDLDPRAVPLAELEPWLAGQPESEVPALFWTAACWAKWIDLSRDDPRAVADAGKAAAIMERVLALDEGYYYGGPHTFFGVYYGSRPPMLGGDLERSAEEFARARALAGGASALVDVLEAQYLDFQRQDREAFHRRLTRVLEAGPPDAPYAFIDAVARDRARRLLAREEGLF